MVTLHTRAFLSGLLKRQSEVSFSGKIFVHFRIQDRIVSSPKLAGSSGNWEVFVDMSIRKVIERFWQQGDASDFRGFASLIFLSSISKKLVKYFFSF